MDLVRALLLLEERLCRAMEFQPGEPWGLMRALEPALFKWTVDKLELLQGWMQRLMHAEEWKPVTKPQGCARCARGLHGLDLHLAQHARCSPCQAYCH